jgi:hypothetical protein
VDLGIEPPESQLTGTSFTVAAHQRCGQRRRTHATVVPDSDMRHCNAQYGQCVATSDVAGAEVTPRTLEALLLGHGGAFQPGELDRTPASRTP